MINWFYIYWVLFSPQRWNHSVSLYLSWGIIFHSDEPHQKPENSFFMKVIFQSKQNRQNAFMFTTDSDSWRLLISQLWTLHIFENGLEKEKDERKLKTEEVCKWCDIQSNKKWTCLISALKVVKNHSTSINHESSLLDVFNFFLLKFSQMYTKWSFNLIERF